MTIDDFVLFISCVDYLLSKTSNISLFQKHVVLTKIDMSVFIYNVIYVIVETFTGFQETHYKSSVLEMFGNKVLLIIS